jgi:hypothetical protein
MQPVGYGDRVLRLAVSKRPHWQTVSRDLLNKVVIAIDPDLDEAFWAAFSVEVVPEMHGEKALVRNDIGRLMFTGTWWWSGD